MRRHLILDYGHVATAVELEALQQQGANVVQYVPAFTYIVSIPDWFSVVGLGIQAAREPLAAEKVSPQLNLAASSNIFALIEFYPDVDMSIARTIALLAELTIKENPDLLSNHLLVQGTVEQLTIMAGWDEVAYIFPASDALVQGSPVNACAGALTNQGSIGQSVAKVGYGWGGPGLKSADLLYSFESVTDKVPSDMAKSEIARAFAEWAKYVSVTFTLTSDPTADRTVAVLFASGAHGDPYSFDGPGGVLAHTFYPYPTNPEPIAGDMHFDADESWHIGSAVDIFSVALHEAGHALGLGHSDQPNAVMYPYYKSATGLTQEDISAVLMLYAAQSSTPPPLTLTVQDPGATTAVSVLSLNGSASGGTSPITVTWSANGFSGTATGSTTWSIPAIPLNNGANSIAVTATDSQPSTAMQTVNITRQLAVVPPSPPTPPTAPTVPTLMINSPASSGTFSAASATVIVSGTAADASGIIQVQWATSRGDSGIASGTTAWSTGPINLASGITTITITAYAQSGTKTSQTLQVSYTAPVTPPTAPPSGSTQPALVILSPATTSLSTSASSLMMNGTAKDNGTMSAVTWSTSNGDSGTATGTESWSIPAVPLLVGTTTITVQAHNSAGIAAWRSVVVTRR